MPRIRTILDAVGDAAVQAGRPVLYAATASAMRRIAKGAKTPEEVAARMEPGQFFNEWEFAAVAAVIWQVHAAGEILGRARAGLQVKGKLKGWSLLARPPETFRKYVERIGADILEPSPAPLAQATRGLRITETFRHPPERALSWLKSLRPETGISTPWLEAGRNAAFSLAVETDAAMLTRVRDTVARAIEEGLGVREAGLTLENLGVTSTNPQYAEMVFRTNAMDAFTRGNYEEVAEDPVLAVEYPFWEYWNPKDGRTGADHWANLTRGVNGTSFYPRNVPFERARGPRAFNCRCQLLRWIDREEAVKLKLLPAPAAA